jgi:hypothetical protein
MTLSGHGKAPLIEDLPAPYPHRPTADVRLVTLEHLPSGGWNFQEIKLVSFCEALHRRSVPVDVKLVPLIVPRRSAMKTFVAVLSLMFVLAAATSMLSLSGQSDRQAVRVSAANVVK